MLRGTTSLALIQKKSFRFNFEDVKFSIKILRHPHKKLNK